MKLHRLLVHLESTGQSDVASFATHGKRFHVHDKNKLEELLPQFFRHGHFKSFKRLLYMYGFERSSNSANGGVGEETYCHADFTRDEPTKCKDMVRKNSTAEQMRLKGELWKAKHQPAIKWKNG